MSGGLDEEEDPLDAFMANLEKDAKEKAAQKTAKKDTPNASGDKEKKNEKGVRDDIDGMDDEESYYKWLEENPNAGRSGLDEDELDIEYDADGNPIAPQKSKYIDPLPPINHAEIDYKPFERNLYSEHSDISGLSRITFSSFSSNSNEVLPSSCSIVACFLLI